MMLRILKTVYHKAFSPANNSVQESDGSFFEGFTALAWRQENKRLRAATEGDKDGDRPPPSEIQYGTKPKLHKLNKNELELLYIEVLYTVKHKIGATSGTHSQHDLFQYAKEAFSVSPEDHALLLARATEEKPPVVVLSVTVIEASGLEAKDADGYSDPYCMLGIMPGRPSSLDNSPKGGDNSTSSTPSPKTPRGQGGGRRFSLSGLSGGKKGQGQTLTVRDHLPARLIRTTGVKPHTLNPEWNEKFRFDLENVNSDKLHLDIWDHDDEFSVIEAAKKLNEVSGLKGLNRFFKQVAQSARSKNGSDNNVDDFLGCVNIPLESVPSTGVDSWYPLEGRTARSHVQGKIHLNLQLATREDRGTCEEDNWTDVMQHEDLMRIFVQHELRLFNDLSYKWPGELPPTALTILHQHAIQGDVTEVQQAVCRWIAISHTHVEKPLSYGLLLHLLENINSLWEPDCLSREEEQWLARSFQNFIDYSLGLLRKLREVYPSTNTTAFCRLEGMLRCLYVIYNSPPFRQCCPFHSELQSDVLAVVKVEEDSLYRLTQLTNAVNVEIYRAFHTYNAVFEQQLEKLLGEQLNHQIAGIMRQHDCDREPSGHGDSATSMDTALFELYLALQEFSGYGKHLMIGSKDLFIAPLGVVREQFLRVSSGADFFASTDVFISSLRKEASESAIKGMLLPAQLHELNIGAEVPQSHQPLLMTSGREEIDSSPERSNSSPERSTGVHNGHSSVLTLVCPRSASKNTSLKPTVLRTQCTMAGNIEPQPLTVSKFYEWFHFTVSRWLHIARHRAERRVRTAVELEKVAMAEVSAKYSASAADVSCCFTQMMEFWSHLDWPDKEGAVTFVYRLAQIVCHCATLYVDLVHTRITHKAAVACEEDTQARVHEEMCVVVNNMEHVRRSLQALPSLLEMSEAQQRALELAAALADADDPHTSLQALVKASNQDVVKKVLHLAEKVANRMRPDLKKDIFHLNWAPESVPAEEAIRNLLKYLDGHLSVLNKVLMKANFDRVLACLWNHTLEEFAEVMDTEEMRPPSFYQRMFDALSLLVDFFFANGRGLEMEDILVDEFQILRKKLTMHKMDTISLIEEFYAEKCEQQRGTSCTEYGVLNIRVVYKHQHHVLIVEILSAKDLIPLDANGLSDPYVVVALCPEHAFPNQSEVSTKIVKKTLNPTFDESFEFQVLPSQCRRRGAVLVFTVMDHDLVFQNDFGGEAFLPLAEVPGIGGEEVSSFDALNVVSLPLIHPVVVDDGALSILRARSWDSEAQEFVRKRSLIEDLAAT
ncbi:BAI1-associated protein 3-like [Babylonia areolata]|uniref:BAI1-associated protein 3-like n=1 Tax=Babylonia areolata TaxID=304850 RepID=UPI003FD4153E